MKQNRNSRRVNETAREALANILLFHTQDPELQLLTVTGCEVSVDRSFMRVFISCEAERYEAVLAALTRAKGHIRSQLARALDWRVTPELDFCIDTTTDHAERIAEALTNVPPTMDVEKDEFGYPVAQAGEGEGEGAVAAAGEDAENRSE
jgi:ribosome-binding factor A